MFYLVLARTVWGAQLYAVGSNEKAAWLSGLRVDRIRWLRRGALQAAALYQPVRYLSGGNQQKVALAKWLAGQARFDPAGANTRGGHWRAL